MRPIEMLLSLAEILTLFVLVVPLPDAARWTRNTAVIALVIAGAQILVEGPRWQMVPAYVLTFILFAIWLFNIVVPGGMHVNRLVSVLGAGVGILVLAISLAFPILLPVFHFPKPTGPYAIGTLTYHWVDSSRPELFTIDARDHRELMVQIWYPARGDPSSARAPYIQDADVLTSAFARVQRKPAFLIGNLPYITSDAIPAAPVAEGQPNYPVLLFLEGLTGFRQMNTFQVEELVSHGYIVAAIDQPYAAATVVFPDGRRTDVPPIEQIQPLVRQSYLPTEPAPILNGQVLPDGIIPYFAQDAVFTLDQLTALNQADPNRILTGRLDLERAGTFGFSLGGIVAGEACQIEPRLRACIVMDAAMPVDVVRAGLKQPTMWITRDADVMRLERERAGGWPEAEIVAHQTSMRAVYESLPGDGYFLRIPGMFHSDFCDVPLWSPLWQWIGAAGPIDVERAHNIVNAYSLAFFDRHLKNQPSPLLDGPSEQYSEVSIETRRH